MYPCKYLSCASFLRFRSSFRSNSPNLSVFAILSYCSRIFAFSPCLISDIVFSPRLFRTRLNSSAFSRSGVVIKISIVTSPNPTLFKSGSANRNKPYFPLLSGFCELPASKEAGFRRRHSKDTGFEPAGSLFSCLSG